MTRIWGMAPDRAYSDKRLQGLAEPAFSLRLMKIRADTAASAAALADYLRRCECIVHVVDERTLIAITTPQSLSNDHQEQELDAYLRVWRAMHPNASADPLPPPGVD